MGYLATPLPSTNFTARAASTTMLAKKSESLMGQKSRCIHRKEKLTRKKIGNPCEIELQKPENLEVKS